MRPSVRTMICAAVATASFLTTGSAIAQVPRAAWFPGGSGVSEPELFPSAFRGRWAPDQTACGDVDGVARIHVLPAGVDAYESGGRLVRVTQAGQQRSIRVRISYEGEGEFWDREEIWTLSPEGDRLSTVAEGESARQLERCD